MPDVTQFMALGTSLREDLTAELCIASRTNNRKIFADQLHSIGIQINGQQPGSPFADGL